MPNVYGVSNTTQGVSMKITRTLILLVVVVLLSSCATIISQSAQKVLFTSDPSEANITITSKTSSTLIASGTTPLELELPRGDEYFKQAKYIVTIKKPGYSLVEYSIQSTLNGLWYIAGNFVFGYVVGWLIVDPLTGAMWRFDEEYHTELMKELSYIPDDKEQVVLALATDLSPELMSKGERINIE